MSLQQSPPMILVVDDDPVIRQILYDALCKRSFRVVLAPNVEMARRILRSATFDLLVLDLHMPGADGAEILDVLRASHAADELPVIVISGDEARESATLESGANDFVRKPIDLEVLIARINANLVRVGRILMPAPERQDAANLRPDIAMVWLHYCPACLSVASLEANLCGRCAAERPPHGWPQVRGSAYPWLGRSLTPTLTITGFVGDDEGAVNYVGTDSQLRRKATIRVVNVDPLTTRLADRHTMIREIVRVGRVRSPHLVKVWDAIAIDDVAVAIVQETLEGVSVAEHIASNGPMSIRDVLVVVRHAALGLFESHRMGIVHGAVHPGNLMLQAMPGGGWFTRVQNFSVHAVNTAEEHQDVSNPEYFAPERLLDAQSADHRVDIYALGCCIYFMLTGRHAFAADNSVLVLRRQIVDEVPVIACDDPAHQRAFDTLSTAMRDATEKKPNARTRNMLVLVEAADQALAQL